MKRYGWAAVVVYLLFSVLDFGLTFFVINLIGAEHVRRGTDYLLDLLVYGKAATSTRAGDIPEGSGILGFLKEWREKHKKDADDAENAAEAEADRKSGSPSGASSGNLWATAVLAYTIHKTLLLPVRLGATAAATPAIVKQLQRWGINIARNPLPEAAKQRGAQAIKTGKDRLDKARGKHNDWL